LDRGERSSAKFSPWTARVLRIFFISPLLEKRVRTAVHRRDGAACVRVRGEDDHRHTRFGALKGLEHADSIQFGAFIIRDHGVEIFNLEPLDGLQGILVYHAFMTAGSTASLRLNISIKLGSSIRRIRMSSMSLISPYGKFISNQEEGRIYASCKGAALIGCSYEGSAGIGGRNSRSFPMTIPFDFTIWYTEM